MTTGLIVPNAGKIFLNDEEITQDPVYKRAQKGIGYLAQEPSVFRKMTVEDNIKSVLEMTNFSEDYQAEKLESLIKEFNLSHREKYEDVPLGIFLDDENKKKLAGLTGETFGHWLCIRYLFVDECLRVQGIGRKIIEAAECEAKKRGCEYAFVDTFSFQAPDFYKKLGYKEVFTLEEYPYAGKRHYYTKVII